MAIVKGALFGLRAKGQYAKTLNYQGARVKNICTRYHKPGGEASILQETRRNIASKIYECAKVAIGFDQYLPPKWLESMRYLRMRNSYMGALLQQSLKLENILTKGDSLRVVKIKIEYEDHFEWAGPFTQTSSRVTFPFFATCVLRGSPVYVNVWQIWGINPTTMQREYSNVRQETRVYATFKRAWLYVKAGDSEIVQMLPCVNLERLNSQGRNLMLGKGFSEDELTDLGFSEDEVKSFLSIKNS